MRERGKTIVLPIGYKVTSKNGRTDFEMQENGNLILLCVGNQKILWSSGTDGRRITEGLYIEVQTNFHFPQIIVIRVGRHR